MHSLSQESHHKNGFLANCKYMPQSLCFWNTSQREIKIAVGELYLGNHASFPHVTEKEKLLLDMLWNDT